MRVFLIITWLVLSALPALGQVNVQPSPSSPFPGTRPETRSGHGVDVRGDPVIDPTENVKALTAAGLKTQEELRNALERLVQAKIDAIEKISALRDKFGLDLAEANNRRIDESMKLRAELNEKLAIAERDRINAIRLVDVNAAADLQRRTSESAAALNAQTTQLANDLRTSTALLADNLRTLVNSTAASQLAVQKQDKDDTSKRLTTIEQAQSEGRGKQAVSDPALVALVQEVQKLSRNSADQAGIGSGQSNVIFYLFGGLLVLAAVGGLILNMNKKPDPVMQALLVELQKRGNS